MLKKAVFVVRVFVGVSGCVSDGADDELCDVGVGTVHKSAFISLALASSDSSAGESPGSEAVVVGLDASQSVRPVQHTFHCHGAFEHAAAEKQRATKAHS